MALRDIDALMKEATHPSQGVAVLGRGLAATAVAVGIVIAIAIVFRPTVKALINVWDTQPEYSFGYLIPIVTLFLLYQRVNELAAIPLEDSWYGTALVVIGLTGHALGRLSTLDTLAQYGFLLVIWGLALSYLGWRAFRTVLVPLAILAAMVPVPNYLLRELSQGLQLLSSRIGVEIIRWCNVSVYLEGNVIDLGVMKLQVVEACSGLRYLFSLLTLSFLVAYFYRAPLWKRLVVLLSAVPITVIMNSLRIAVVGVTVERWGRETAEGVLHEFEGVTIFLGCVVLLLAEIWLLSWNAVGSRKVSDLLAIDLPRVQVGRLRGLIKVPGAPAWCAAFAIALAAIVSIPLHASSHTTSARPAFSEFPQEIGGWRGSSRILAADVSGLLKQDDYLLADYADISGHRTNLYVSYYDRQAEGNSAHSPRACIPGDGWEIQSFSAKTLSEVSVPGGPLQVNRVVIQKGENRALVYYWFQQRGRFVRGEYATKLYILADALLRGRTDGAMVRLVAALDASENLEAADARLEAFAYAVMPELRRFIPE
jgi:exosortase D (VPLPA-CTERM-specific)